jgi:hypothetical protein
MTKLYKAQKMQLSEKQKRAKKKETLTNNKVIVSKKL